VKRTLIIAACLVALLLVVTFIFFEIKDVPDIKNGYSYDTEEKDTGGLWLFYRMLESRYGKNQVDLVESDGYSYLADIDDHLLIIASSNLGLDSK